MRMNRLTNEQRTRIVACLVEGNSIRATCRMTGVSKDAVLALLADLGEVCHAFHDEKVRGLRTKRVQCDEIWSFCGAKNRNVPKAKLGDENYGDVWTWTAMDADSKLMIS